MATKEHIDALRTCISKAVREFDVTTTDIEGDDIIYIGGEWWLKLTEGDDIPCNCEAEAGSLTVDIEPMFREWDPAPRRMQWEVWAERSDDGSYLYLQAIAELIVETLVGNANEG